MFCASLASLVTFLSCDDESYIEDSKNYITLEDNEDNGKNILDSSLSNLDSQVKNSEIDSSKVVNDQFPYWEADQEPVDAHKYDANVNEPVPCLPREKYQTKCFRENEKKECKDVRRCDGEYWDACLPIEPSKNNPSKDIEECNGIDDECNLIVDDSKPEEIAPLFSIARVFNELYVPEASEILYQTCGTDEGTCKTGRVYCQIDHKNNYRYFGHCYGAILPAIEIFDNLDNDCDSLTDEENNY